MKVIFIIVNMLALGTAFTSPSVIGRPTSAVYGFGDRLKNLIGSKQDKIAVLDVSEMPSVDDVEAVTPPPPEPEKGKSETEKLMQQVKESGVAGVISYALWEVSLSFVP